MLAANSFATLANGRQPGMENVNSHFRKGVPGDWRNHFSRRVAGKFREGTGDLVWRLGYD